MRGITFINLHKDFRYIIAMLLGDYKTHGMEQRVLLTSGWIGGSPLLSTFVPQMLQMSNLLVNMFVLHGKVKQHRPSQIQGNKQLCLQHNQ